LLTVLDKAAFYPEDWSKTIGNDAPPQDQKPTL